jgi:hypothetical protein
MGLIYRYKKGTKLKVTADGEKHVVYKKESSTGQGEGVKGHIMVNHPTKNKGVWDTIDLTKEYGVKTITQGVAAEKKWHKENPYKKVKKLENGGKYTSQAEYESHLLDPYSKEKRDAGIEWNKQKLLKEKPKTKAQWEIDKETKTPRQLGYFDALFSPVFNTNDTGKKDYSDFSSFNSAFRNARNNKEAEFIFKQKKYNTKLIPKEASDEYHESKKFLEDYYKNNDIKPVTSSDTTDAATEVLKKKFNTTWLDYYNKNKDKIGDFSYDSPQRDTLHMLDTNMFLDKNRKEVNDYMLKNKNAKELKNLNDKSYYFSISTQKPKDMSEDGYISPKDKKIFINANPEKGNKINTTYIHELSHKADEGDTYRRTPRVDIDKINKNPSLYDLMKPGIDHNKSFEYLSKPTEIEARKMSLLYYLNKNKKNWKNLSEEELNNLYTEKESKENNMPYDVKQLLDLYQLQKKDLRKYLNNDFTKDK